MKKITSSLEEMQAFARDWLSSIVQADLHVKKKEARQALVVGLYGDLGSGKTAFAQAVAKALGIAETVTSPTFVIEKIYKIDLKINTQSTSLAHLIHIDAYRLEKSEELLRLGWHDIIANPANIILIEWPEKVADIMPADHIRLMFSFVDETTREVTYPKMLQ